MCMYTAKHIYVYLVLTSELVVFGCVAVKRDMLVMVKRLMPPYYQISIFAYFYCSVLMINLLLFVL